MRHSIESSVGSTATSHLISTLSSTFAIGFISVAIPILLSASAQSLILNYNANTNMYYSGSFYRRLMNYIMLEGEDVGFNK